MSNTYQPTLEHMNEEIESLGSMVRSLSTQIAGMRARVTDLEEFGVSYDSTERTGILAMGKDTDKGKKPGKGGKGKGNKGK